MEMCLKGKFLIFGCFIFGLIGYHSAEALQCYVCDDCVDGTELEAMQICGELPFESTSSATPTQSPTNSPTTVSPTQIDGSSSSSTTSSTTSSSSSSSTSTVVTSTRRPSTTTKKPTTKSDSEENYSDYEDSGEGDRRRHFSILGDISEDKKSKEKSLKMQEEPVCYVVKFRVNNTRVASLGCTSLIQNNIYLTCLSLNRMGAVMENCELCGKNGCNKKIFLNETEDDYDYPWFNTGSRKAIEIFYCVLLLLLLKLFN